MEPEREALVSIEDETRDYLSINSTEFESHGHALERPQYVAVIAASLCALSSGVVLGWTSPMEASLEDGEFNGIQVNENEMSWVGSLPNVGALLACIPTGYICDAIGRKATLMLLLIPFTLGWLLIMLASNALMICVGRFITGLSVGAGCVVVPIYISEVAHKKIRGHLATNFQLFGTFGVLYAYCFGAFLNPMIYTVVCAFSILAFAFIFVFQPETPLYYLQSDDLIKADETLQNLRGQDYNITNEMLEMVETARDGHMPFIDVLRSFRRRQCYRSLYLALTLMFFQQFSGINVIIFYSSDIFNHAGIKMDPRYCSIIVGAFQVLATYFSSLLIDRWGRRWLLISSALLMSASITSLATFFYVKQHKLLPPDTINALSWLAIIFLIMYIVAFSFGFGPVPWVLCGELFAMEIKAFACSLAGCLNWFLAFLVTKMYLQVNNRVGEDNTFFAFGFMMLCAAIHVFYQLPETKGMTVAEIQEELESQD